MDEVENFFFQFPNPWALRVSGMGGYTSKCEKSQNHCTLLHNAQCINITVHKQVTSTIVLMVSEKFSLYKYFLYSLFPNKAASKHILTAEIVTDNNKTIF